MADQSIRGYLGSLDQRGELVRFSAEVDPLADLTAVGWKAYDRLGKASLFENVKGFPGWRVANQIVCDRRKWAIALGVDDDDVVAEMGARIEAPIAPISVAAADAPVKEVVLEGEAADLTRLPAAWTSELDPGPYLAAGMAVIRDPETGLRNVSIHRQQVQGPDRTGFLICPRQAQRIYQKYRVRGEAMPVAIVVGAHPLIYFAAAYTAAMGADEFAVAGGLIGEPVRLVRCETMDLEVPAEAEIVIEGEIPPDELVAEGPFGEGSGGYGPAGVTQVVHVKAITRRREPVFYAMQCGAPMTDAQGLVQTSSDMLLWRHLANVEGGLDLLDLRSLGIAGLMAVVIKLRPRVAGQAKTALLAALSGPQLHPKLVIAVDDDIDAGDMRQVFWSLTTRVEAGRDVVRIPNTRTWSLDNASDVVLGQDPMYRVGAKWLIDATRPVGAEARERFARAMPLNYDTVELEDFLP